MIFLIILQLFMRFSDKITSNFWQI